MKKTACILLVIALLASLCGCTMSEAYEGTVAASADMDYGEVAAADAAPMETEPAPTETEPEPTEPPDAGIASVTIQVPEDFTLTPATETAPLNVSFTGVDPTGAPRGGRICTLTLLREDEQIGDARVFALKDGASLELPLDYHFERYMPDAEETLTLRLEYGEEQLSQDVTVRLVNDPDEVYAEASGDKLPYAVDVLRNENVVVVYGKDEAGEYTMPVHVFLCSTGRSTPTGRYTIGWKVPWRALFGGVCGQYAMHIVGNILFHSVPYYYASKDALESEEFNKLGTAASLGCVRMAVQDVKWIYDHCPSGTSVHIYDVETLEFEKPEQIILDLSDERCGWDPTDPDEENPWRTTDGE